MSDSSDAESGIAAIEAFYAQTPEQGTLTLAGQDADILLNHCSIEDITGKASTQPKAPALILNPNGEVIVRKMFDNSTQANLKSQFGVLNNQSEFAVATVRRGEQNGVIIAGVPFLLSPIPSLFFLPPSFLSYLPPSLLTPIFGRNELLLKDQNCVLYII